MGADVRAIDVGRVPVDPALIIERDAQPPQDPIEKAFACPPPVPAVDGFPFSVGFWHGAPVCAAVEDPKDAFEDGAVLGPFPAASLLGEEGSCVGRRRR